ncbi:hypothetical protein N566_03775 [Streptomycetaceae bacterium MP113-05]|nr:hypothetical protein N566_03775 [Streptomycetaceae bacterium MP113-05]
MTSAGVHQDTPGPLQCRGTAMAPLDRHRFIR